MGETEAAQVAAVAATPWGQGTLDLQRLVRHSTSAARISTFLNPLSNSHYIRDKALGWKI